MGKKLGFFVGLVAGAAAAHVAYHRLTDAQKAELKADLQEKADIAKDRAVDYAFYASDAWDDLKETFSDQSQQVSDRVKQATSQFEAKHASEGSSDEDLRAELAQVSSDSEDDSDDIVLNSEETFGGADVTDEPETTTDEALKPTDETDEPDKDENK